MSGLPIETRQRQVAALVPQLATAARAFLLYDARNDAVRRSLDALLQSFAAALASEPRLRLEIRPFEIECDGQRVYLDRDREHSLAFRLYRDGVRAMVFRAGFDAGELARLLEILSLRYGGIHQHEDDTVTLLWKAGLRFLDVIAVEGLTPDGGPSDEATAASPPEPRPYLPEDVDLPVTVSARGTAPRWVEIGAEALEALREEAGSGQLLDDSLRLLSVLARALEDPEARMPFRELVRLCEETRDTLLSAESLSPLLAFVRQLQQLARSQAPWDPDRHSEVVALILSCGTDVAVQQLVHSVPSTQPHLRGEMIELLDIVCPDPFTAVAEALASEERPSARAVARQLLEHYGKRHSRFVRERFGAAHGRLAADLLRSLARLEGDAAAEFLARQCAHPDPEVREEALWHIERTGFTSALGHGLVEALRRTEGEHRQRVLKLVERSRDRRFVAPLLRLLELGPQDPAAAMEIARVIGRLEGRQGLQRWERWLKPKGRFFRRRLPGTALQQATAAAAVAQVPGEEAAHLLRLTLPAADKKARPWIERLLEQRTALAWTGDAS